MFDGLVVPAAGRLARAFSPHGVSAIPGKGQNASVAISESLRGGLDLGLPRGEILIVWGVHDVMVVGDTAASAVTSSFEEQERRNRRT